MEDYDINNSFYKKKSKYETIYKTDKGDITLYINKHYNLILEYLDKTFPKLEKHASTQMTLVSHNAQKLMNKFNVTRIVPAPKKPIPLTT